MQHWVLMTTAAAFLVGCDMVEMPTVATNTSDALPSAAEDTCGAANFANLIGQPRSTVEAAGLPTTARIVGPEEDVMVDFNSQELNVVLNTNNLVERLTCG